MTGELDIRYAQTAFMAGCGNWVAVDERYVVLPSGKTRCLLHALSWVTTSEERRQLLGKSAAPTGTA